MICEGWVESGCIVGETAVVAAGIWLGLLPSLGAEGARALRDRGAYDKAWSAIESVTARTTLMFGWCCSTRCV